jgi:4,4'-diaponeurosporenoate glycosyltransferase
MMIALGLMFLGLLASRLLFWRFPKLKGDNNSAPAKKSDRLSIIIPARDEEKSLPLLLGDLKKQTVSLYEIICVDDGSTDQTPEIIRASGARLITPAEKPANWIGKSWACQHGSEAATGELFLFMDADVRLSPAGIGKLLQAYENNGMVISVMPYHQIGKMVENLSLFFNCIQFGANGMGLPKCHQKEQKIGKKSDPSQTSLYGPVILISREDYWRVGGHEVVKDSIVDDMAMGEKLRDKGIPFTLFLGNEDISYRMYGGGVLDLIRGWTKNQATGAVKTPVVIGILVFLWVTSCASAPFYLIFNLLEQNWLFAGGMLVFYGIWMFEVRRIAHHLGSFSTGSTLIYPVPLIFYLLIFMRSMFKRIFGLPVIWKDRKIRLEK